MPTEGSRPLGQGSAGVTQYQQCGEASLLVSMDWNVGKTGRNEGKESQYHLVDKQ